MPSLVKSSPELADESARGATDSLAILIVDDSEDDVLLVERRIRNRFPQAQCTRVDNAEDMRAALSNRRWDLVISDHQMPSFDSLAALETLKASGLDIPFIIYSGELGQQQGVSAMEDGAQDFVYKNAPERLLPAIERELAHWHTRRAKETAERSIVRLANFDELTGLPNRSQFGETLDERLQAATLKAAICYLDLDRFMRINESFGYAAGDTLIRQVGERLSARFARDGIVARMGRDEFAVMFVLQEGQHPTACAELVLQTFAAPFSLGGQELYLTPSMGLSLFPEHGADAMTLMKNAESAMFDAKQNGRKAFQVYRTEINIDSRLRLLIESGLRNAIARDEMSVVYQPFYDLTQRKIIGAEALLRWNHPELGMVSPLRFIPIADETGQILDIGAWALQQACAQTKRWQNDGHFPFTIAVNMSAAQFRQSAVTERVEQVLNDTQLPPASLELEITETLAMQDAPATIATLRRLKDLGVQLAIDDFGTGYSSLAYLKRFPLDILKIDQSFIRDIHRSEDDATIVRAILALARALKLVTHAEGIETPEQLQFLVNERCDRVQGFLYGNPLSVADLTARMEQSLKERALGRSIPAAN
ncbi:MAG TPA: GGDEF domain-containing response regulator [Burkholderiales bacterium]|jgi:diguanylate cyclase|nr:GGDEF domain-containing response regulator [Burkholderiales bacterium]